MLQASQKSTVRQKLVRGVEYLAYGMTTSMATQSFPFYRYAYLIDLCVHEMKKHKIFGTHLKKEKANSCRADDENGENNPQN